MSIRNRAARRHGHSYVMGNVNAYCPACSVKESRRSGRSITVLTCQYDNEED